MKSFIKNNFAMISKMFIQQIGIAFLGFLLNTAANVSGNKSLVLGLSIFSAAFYLFLVYVHVWEFGVQDKIRIEAGRIKFDPLKGLKASLIANSVNILLAVLSAIGYLCIDRNILDEFGNIVSPAWAVNLYAVSHIIGVFLQSMYNGIGSWFGIDVYPYFLFLAILPSLITSFFGYYFGTKEKYGLFTSAPKK